MTSSASCPRSRSGISRVKGRIGVQGRRSRQGQVLSPYGRLAAVGRWPNVDEVSAPAGPRTPGRSPTTGLPKRLPTTGLTGPGPPLGVGACCCPARPVVRVHIPPSDAAALSCPAVRPPLPHVLCRPGRRCAVIIDDRRGEPASASMNRRSTPLIPRRGDEPTAPARMSRVPRSVVMMITVLEVDHPALPPPASQGRRGLTSWTRWSREVARRLDREGAQVNLVQTSRTAIGPSTSSSR